MILRTYADDAHNPSENITQPLDAVEKLPESLQQRSKWNEPVDVGRYLEVAGSSRTLVIPMTAEVIRLGRGLMADVRIDDVSVSRRHALLVLRTSGQCILDDRSYNGTFVNGVRIQQAELFDGDVVSLGSFLLRFRDVADKSRRRLTSDACKDNGRRRSQRVAGPVSGPSLSAV